MELKKYQQKTIDLIKTYLKEIQFFGDPKHAFISLTDQPYKEKFFDKIPFVCIKIPTGGGKTLVGCYAVTEIMDSFLKEKMGRGIVMWFVPSEAIKSQTLRKFKDRKDIHRKILDDYFDNNVKIFSNEESLKIRKEDVENNLCIIISSLDAFRKEKSLQNKYKVYQENGALITHFENIECLDILEKDESGIIKSLANVIRLSNPLLVIDEGHKTKTELSITFLKELNPSFVIEYTATPREESNVLVEIRSSELKDEEMVKLPLILESHTQWQAAILQGVLRREELEKIAKKEKELIRPIALLQAEQEKEDENKITVGKIRELLIKDRKISEEEIAIKTSKTNDLERVDLFSKNCKIRYIITVNALAEGWDCSFAYVLISVANIGSKIAVEQIIGRIMRMPYAKRREIEDLNRSYIFASARNFNEAVNQIISGLESNGYSKHDIINATATKQKYEFDVDRRVKEDFVMPLMAIGNEELTFEELIGEKFELHKQDAVFEFKVHYDADGRAIIDIKENDKWFKGRQQTLKLTYQDKNCSKKELIQWLDKKLRFTMLDKEDKVKFLEKTINEIKGHTISDLSINRYVLLIKLDEVINNILVDYSKKIFDKLLKEEKIKTIEFEKFPEIITLSEDISQEFNRNYYTKIDKLNKEEQRFIERLDLDALTNIKFWIRNREKKDPFYLLGWQRNKFYPDFIAVTNKGNILVLEWKGEDRISNEDTEYKEKIGKIWEKLCGGKSFFFLVHNKNIESVLIQIKKL
ncbi:TPA: DEAD/DEAH box helicase family protein [Candidatus Woesearchaeota archaeon]|nr:DEAD/DEAH box helicase family protein [Candidatus Woesearchaeota archaeon]HIH31198.1 DEAD/DEAH box helicase family protein [Candidatus Woesearchaeota archaeon]HIH55535.1 DEAD/DEAH box helicase family protein [Candidatus Woesearchaeota archaeon]HIJ01844.1 DEAD/DEAH box helicase family protein [Candidatus Woesearchaeota archaeon]HIJ13137.1 DEAD/DEAH box helicase family protein [Candidatus Woesearchaeota archaeon]